MPLSIRERVPYVAIVDRPSLTLPDGVRMPVWVIVNVENWDPRRAMPRAVLPPPMGNPLLPDVPNWSWHEYGMRVGFWRIFKSLNDRCIVPTLATNGSVCETYPRIVQAAHEKGWELMGHGWLQGPMHVLEDQKASIRRTMNALRAVSGKNPRGWESPGLTETQETIDLLAGEGIEYVADWVLDDLPCEIKTASSPILSVPYTVEINDVAISAVAQHSSDEILKRGIRQFDRLYEECEKAPRIMSISLHPYLTGVPHRIGFVEELLDYISSKPGAVFWTGEQIVDWYRQFNSGGA
ncbi:polysaccharide deacetylase family protein [Lichenifustis flavocetrariae]|uniref:Chitooligosaccharide deacetylase n=1 Tax=Lichenifustis flavocetrariae TaxID=2949735 RepID=A0AA41YZ15_9HYPH|nr:polysaccharide deacetylase family protein [Lichenifustis flavocetrariae]MCW6511211.1 polysaccharide deacetylase family protein [Lichenifustis flavocetrariae]